MRAADTNVVVRLLIRDNEDQLAIAEGFISQGVWVSQLVLAEAIWVLNDAYGVNPAGTASMIEMLLKEQRVSIQDADVVAAALDQYRRRPSLGFTDCLILEIARKAGHLPLGTFDRTLSKLDGAQRL